MPRSRRHQRVEIENPGAFRSHGFFDVNRLGGTRIVSEKLEGTRVLDVGCGDSAFITKLKKKNRQREFLGVDFSPPMIEIAKRRGLNASLMDMLSQKFKDQPFDSVYAVRSIMNFLDRQREAESQQAPQIPTSRPPISSPRRLPNSTVIPVI